MYPAVTFIVKEDGSLVLSVEAMLGKYSLCGRHFTYFILLLYKILRYLWLNWGWDQASWLNSVASGGNVIEMYAFLTSKLVLFHWWILLLKILNDIEISKHFLNLLVPLKTQEWKKHVWELVSGDLLYIPSIHVTTSHHSCCYDKVKWLPQIVIFHLDIQLCQHHFLNTSLHCLFVFF